MINEKWRARIRLGGKFTLYSVIAVYFWILLMDISAMQTDISSIESDVSSIQTDVSSIESEMPSR